MYVMALDCLVSCSMLLEVRRGNIMVWR